MKNKRLILFCMIGMLSLSATSWGATYYVSTSGSDLNPGSSTLPFRTVTRAVDKMVAGDTTYVRGGVYKECNIRFKKSGTSSAPIRLLAVSGMSPVIQCGDRNKLVIFLQHSSGPRYPIGYITIEGFEIRDGNTGIRPYSANNLVIRRNKIYGNGHGILGSGYKVLVDRNMIYNNGWYKKECIAGNGKYLLPSGSNVCNKNHGLYITGVEWTVTNNLIYDNLTTGIQVAGYSYNPDNVASSLYAGASNYLIANNTIAYNNFGPAISLWQSGTVKIKIINNIVYENGNAPSFPSTSSQGISFYGTAGGNVVQNNLFYATKPGGLAAYGGKPGWETTFTQSGNIINKSSPLFVNAPATLPSSPNFVLTSRSPAINKGLNLSAPSTKTSFNGLTRPRDTYYDIGAYEY